jgi:hypothetical protein
MIPKKSEPKKNGNQRPAMIPKKSEPKQKWESKTCYDSQKE